MNFHESPDPHVPSRRSRRQRLDRIGSESESDAANVELQSASHAGHLPVDREQRELTALSDGDIGGRRAGDAGRAPAPAIEMGYARHGICSGQFLHPDTTNHGG